MPSKIGIVLALDGERQFTTGMKNAQKSARLAEQGIKNLSKEYDGNANSLEALSKKQDALKTKQDALNRVVEQAKQGQKNARDNYKKTSEALNKYEQELDDAEKELKKMERSGKTATTEYKKQEKAVEDLRKKVEKQGLEYQKAEGALTDWDREVSKAESDLKQNSKALDKNAQYLDEAKSSANGAATSIDEFGKEVKDATQSTDEMNISLGSMIKNKLVDLGADVLQDLGRAAIDAAKKVIEVGSQFEASMSKVQSLSGASNTEMKAMSDKAKALGSSTKFSASQVADAFGYMALAGYSASDSISAIDGVVNLAAASEMDLAQASDMVTDYLSAFGLEASDAGKLVDELAFAQANSNTTTEQLGEAYANCAANAHANGQSVEDVTAILEGFANQGLKGSRAGTALNSMMSDMVKNMKDGKIQIGDTAVAVTDAQGNFRDMTDILSDVEAATAGMSEQQRAEALQAVFQRKSLQAVNTALSEGMDNIKSYKKDLEDCDGAADGMAKTMQDNLAGKVTEFNSAVEGLGIQLFEYFSGPLTGAVEIATGIISGITDLITPQKTEMESFISDTESMNKQVAASIKAAQDTAAEGAAKAAEISAVGEQLGNILASCDEYNQITLEDGTTAIVDSTGKVIASFNEVDGTVDTASGNLAKFGTEGLPVETLVNDAMTAQGAIGYIETETDTVEKRLSTFAADGINTQGVETGKSAIVEIFDEAGNKVDTFEAQVSASGDVEIPVEGKGIQTGTNAIITCFDNSTNSVSSFKGSVEELASGDLNINSLSDNFDRLAESTQTTYHITDAYTKMRISNYVKTVGQYVHGLSDAWDETTGTLTASREELKKWFGEASQKARFDALQDSVSLYYKAWADAAVAVTTAQSGLNAILAEASRDARDNFSGVTEDFKSLEDISAFYADHPGWFGGEAFVKAVATETDAVNTATASMQEAEEGINNADKTLETFTVDLDDNADAGKKVSDSQKKASKTADEMTTALGMVVTAADDSEESMDALEQTISDLDAAAIQAIADASAASAQRIKDAFDGAKESVKSAFSINPFSEWQMPEDGLEKMMEAFDSQISGFTRYSENLQIVSQHIGKEITPEFMKYLQDLGTDGARVMADLARAFEQGNVDAVEEVVQQYTDALDVQDQIANIMAFNDLAIQLGLNQLGSSVEEWGGLSDAVSTALDGLGEDVSSELSTEFDTAVEAAQKAGVEIPEGLADSIKNSEYPEQAVRSAIAQLNAAIESQGKSLVKVAQSAGFTVTDEMAKRIEAGGADGQKALMELVNSIANTDTSAAAEKTTAGTDFTEAVAENIEDGEETVTDAAGEVVSEAATEAETSAEEAEAAGKQIGTSMILGMAGQHQLAAAAAVLLVAAAKLAADAAVPSFNSTGSNAGSNFVSGISSQNGSAASAGSTLGLRAKSGAATYENSFYSIGVNMASGLGRGIMSKAASIASQAASLVRNAVAAAKREGEIQSPSKKMDREVGRMLAFGLASGIKWGQKPTVEAAQTLMNTNLKSLQSWLVKNKQKVLKTGVVWTDFISQAWTGLASKAARALFNISPYTKDENGKTVRKDATVLSQEVIRAAEQYLSNVQASYKTSEKDVLKYWETVRSQLTQGTQAWYDATNKIRELRESIGSEAVAEQMFDTVTTYYDLSAKAEMQYWAAARKRYAKGTDDRVAADKRYLEAREKYYGDLKDLDQDYQDDLKKLNEDYSKDAAKAEEERARDVKKINDQLAKDKKQKEKDLAREIKSINKQLSSDLKKITTQLNKDIDAANKRYTDAVASRRDELLNSFGLFDAFESRSANGQELLFNLQSQVAGMKDWQKTINDLSKRGVLSSGLISELTAQGPQQSAAIHALSMLSDAELKAYNAAYQQKQDFAQKQALSENAALKEEVKQEIKDLKAQASKDRQALKDTAAEKIKKLQDSNAKAIKKLEDTAAKQIEKRNKAAAKEAKDLEKQLKADTKELKSTWKSERKAMTKDISDQILKLAKNIDKTASDEVSRIVSQLKTLRGLKDGAASSVSAKTKKGNASGTRYLTTPYAWMNEYGTIEPIVRKSDGAMLNMNAMIGDGIIPAANVGNLYDWSRISPQAIAQQQAALQSYMANVTRAVSAAALNSRLASGPAAVSSYGGYDDTSMLGLMRQMVALLEQGKNIYLDSGALVGGTADAMSNNFAMRSRRLRG